MYVITDWIRYEVSTKGRQAKPGDALQAGKLKFIRQKARGRSQGVGYRKLKDLVGKEKIMEVLGVWGKFLEIAGDQPAELRGRLLNEKDKPASVKDLAFILDVPEDQIAITIEALSNPNIGWINKTNRTKTNLIKTKQTKAFQEIPETPGITRKMQDKTPLKGSCLRKIKNLLNTMGISVAQDRNKYALEIRTAGLTDKDVEWAAKEACEKVANGQTRGSEELGGVVGQKGWTKELQIAALKYMRGTLNNKIKSSGV